jgi:hypothetical protein
MLWALKGEGKENYLRREKDGGSRISIISTRKLYKYCRIA